MSKLIVSLAVTIVLTAAVRIADAAASAHTQEPTEKPNIVLFLVDDMLSNHGRGGQPETHNLPLSCGKGSPREGGVRVPMIARWPGVTSPGSVCDDYLIIEDYFTTILEIAGAQPDVPVDGVSFVPLLKGETGLNRSRPPPRSKRSRGAFPHSGGHRRDEESGGHRTRKAPGNAPNAQAVSEASGCTNAHRRADRRSDPDPVNALTGYAGTSSHPPACP